MDRRRGAGFQRRKLQLPLRQHTELPLSASAAIVLRFGVNIYIYTHALHMHISLSISIYMYITNSFSVCLISSRWSSRLRLLLGHLTLSSCRNDNDFARRGRAGSISKTQLESNCIDSVTFVIARRTARSAGGGSARGGAEGTTGGGEAGFRFGYYSTFMPGAQSHATVLPQHVEQAIGNTSHLLVAAPVGRFVDWLVRYDSTLTNIDTRRIRRP